MQKLWDALWPVLILALAPGVALAGGLAPSCAQSLGGLLDNPIHAKRPRVWQPISLNDSRYEHFVEDHLALVSSLMRQEIHFQVVEKPSSGLLGLELLPSQHNRIGRYIGHLQRRFDGLLFGHFPENFKKHRARGIYNKAFHTIEIDEETILAIDHPLSQLTLVHEAQHAYQNQRAIQKGDSLYEGHISFSPHTPRNTQRSAQTNIYFKNGYYLDELMAYKKEVKASGRHWLKSLRRGRIIVGRAIFANLVAHIELGETLSQYTYQLFRRLAQEVAAGDATVTLSPRKMYRDQVDILVATFKFPGAEDSGSEISTISEIQLFLFENRKEWLEMFRGNPNDPRLKDETHRLIRRGEEQYLADYLHFKAMVEFSRSYSSEEKWGQDFDALRAAFFRAQSGFVEDDSKSFQTK